jgi:hypothetical protein
VADGYSIIRKVATKGTTDDPSKHRTKFPFVDLGEEILRLITSGLGSKEILLTSQACVVKSRSIVALRQSSE